MVVSPPCSRAGQFQSELRAFSDSSVYVYSDGFHRDMNKASACSAQAVVSLGNPASRSVLDVGCGLGAWVSEYCTCAVNDFPGVDGEFIDLRSLSIPVEHFWSCDILMHGPAAGENPSALGAVKLPR